MVEADFLVQGATKKKGKKKEVLGETEKQEKVSAFLKHV